MNKYIVVSRWSPEQTARIVGTGIDVLEVILTYKETGSDWEALRQAFHWLSEEQLRAALTYYGAHRDALDQRLAADEGVEERVAELWRRHPQTKPPTV